MYKIIDSAGINIIRVGLKSSDLISPDALIGGGSFHPAFRQLVEGEIAKEVIESHLKKVANDEVRPATREEIAEITELLMTDEEMGGPMNCQSGVGDTMTWSRAFS